MKSQEWKLVYSVQGAYHRVDVYTISPTAFVITIDGITVQAAWTDQAAAQRDAEIYATCD